jgi:tripartite-type tricarboxylate transporter receptor subunit TctC
LAAAPDVPTTTEAGLSGFNALSWQAAFLPKGASKQVIARLNSAIMAALADPIIRQRLADVGQESFPREQQTPEALGTLQRVEVEKWWPIIKAAGIKGE